MSAKIYLAGPEVFLPDAAAVIAAKCDLVRAAGLVPLAPGDANVPGGLQPFDQGLFISRLDESLMQEADAVIANLTPMRGVGADPGTAYELGFMAASGKPVFAYTNDPRVLADRVRDNGLALPMPDGRHRDGQGLLIEDFDMPENLMLTGSVVSRGHPVIVHAGGGRIAELAGFERALAQAKRKLG